MTKQVFINDARVTLSTASESSEFYSISVSLPDELAEAILEEQKRKFELSEYLAKLREAGRARTDPMAIKPPAFLEVDNNGESESEEKPKPKRGRPRRVSE
jgi:hypothetical protein